MDANETKTESDQAHQNSLMLAVLMMVLMLIGIGLMWMVLQRILLRPLKKSMEHIKHITRGNLTEIIEVEGRNEMGQLAISLRAMQQSLTRTVSDARSGANVIYTSASKISLDSGDLASRTEQRAASLEETAASMEELTATVKQNADNARQAVTEMDGVTQQNAALMEASAAALEEQASPLAASFLLLRASFFSAVK